MKALTAEEVKQMPRDNLPLEVITGLIFTCAVVFQDPVVPDALETILELKQSDIRVIMCTGDLPATAKFVAHATGILEDGDEERPILQHSDLESLTDQEFGEAIKTCNVFAR